MLWDPGARAWWRSVALLLLCGPGLASHVGALQATDPIAARAAEGAAAMRAGRFDAAAAIYAELTTARPDDAGLLMNLGMARYMAGHPDQALGPLQKSARLNPSLAPASLFLGASLLDLGRPADATPHLLRAVTAMPQNADAREMLARAYLEGRSSQRRASNTGRSTTTQPKIPRGGTGSREVTKDQPRRRSPRCRNSRRIRRCWSWSSPTLPSAKRSIQLRSQSIAAYWRARRLSAGCTKRSPKSTSVRESPNGPRRSGDAIKPRPAAECAAHVAECEFLAGKFRESLAAAMQSPTSGGPLLDDSRRQPAGDRSGRPPRDAASLRRTPPDSRRARTIQRTQYGGGGRGPAAAEAVAGKSSSSRRTRRGALAGAQHSTKRSRCSNACSRERPNDASLTFMYGDALLESQQIDRAIPILERVAVAKDAPVAVHASLGRAYVQVGRYEDALPALDIAAKQDEDGRTHLQLARAFQALGAQRTRRRRWRSIRNAASGAASLTSGGGEKALTPPKD